MKVCSPTRVRKVRLSVTGTSWLTLAGLLAMAAVSLPHAASAAATSEPKLVTITIPDPKGYIPTKWLSYPGPPRAGVLLPANYDPRRRYPFVLNLGGLGGNYAAASFGPSFHVHAILVTPEPGSGWYADWWNNGQRGDPAWESYYLNEVMPYVLSHYRIRPERRFHAIIGGSMGGLGAAYLGGRLPGFFGTVASLSGFLDPQYGGAITGEAMGLTAFAPAKGDYIPYPVLGPPDGFYAAGHNPTRLIRNLQYTRILATAGTGVPSDAQLERPGNLPGSALEAPIIRPMNEDFHRAALAAHVSMTFRLHRGGHDSVDFSQEMKEMLAWGLFKPVATQPRSWINDTVATRGQVWDIGYRFDRPPTRVVRFDRNGDSLTISAAGSPVTITTSSGCVIHTDTPATVAVANCKHG